jgi:hypothetical protein
VRAVLALWLLCLPSIVVVTGASPTTRGTWSGPASQSPKHKDTTRLKPRGSADSPLFVKVVPTPPSQEELTREARQSEEKAASDRGLVQWTRVVAVATTVLAVATFVLMVLTGISVVLLLRQGRDLKAQREVMQSQAGHLEEQAVQLKATVAAMEGTAEHQLRAYVFAIAGRIEDAFSAKGGKVVVILQNSGQTPAYDCTVRYDTRLVKDTEPCPTTEPANLAQSRGDIAPGASKNMSIGLRALGSGERAALEQVGGGAILYAFGRIQYTDAFKKERRQWFCYAFGGIYGSSDSGGLAEVWHGQDTG